MVKKIKFWSGEKIMSITAVLISVVTLGVFIYQTNLIRKEQHTAVFPYLDLGHSGLGTNSYRFTLENKGIGPAIITEVKLLYKNKEIEENLIQYVSKRRDTVNYSFNYQGVYRNRFISSGEEIVLIGTSNKSRKEAAFFENLLLDENLDLVITYESIYGEAWKISKLVTGAKQLD